jgi:hypothetical protein
MMYLKTIGTFMSAPRVISSQPFHPEDPGEDERLEQGEDDEREGPGPEVELVERAARVEPHADETEDEGGRFRRSSAARARTPNSSSRNAMIGCPMASDEVMPAKNSRPNHIAPAIGANQPQLLNSVGSVRKPRRSRCRRRRRLHRASPR